MAMMEIFIRYLKPSICACMMLTQTPLHVSQSGFLRTQLFPFETILYYVVVMLHRNEKIF